MIVKLTVGELKELEKTDATHRDRGGFQSFIVGLQWRIKDDSGELDLDHEDLIKINRYAGYTSGGYQSRLKKIFGRTLGRYLENLVRK